MSLLLRAWVSTSALYLSGVLLPVGGVLLMLFTPQPGLRLERSHGTPALLALIALVAATAALVGGWLAAVLYLAGFASLTLLLPLLLRQGWSIEITVGAVTAALATAVAAAVFGFLAAPASVWAGLETLLRESRDVLLEMYRQAEVSREQVEALEGVTADLVTGALRLAPALGLIGLGLTVLLNLFLVRWHQRRTGGAPVFGDLTRWRAPGWLVWGLIASGYGMFLPEGSLQTLAVNLFAVVAAIELLQGVAIVQFWLARWSSPPWLRVLFWVIVAAEWLFAAGVALLGVFDLWADFRRLDPRPVADDEDE